MKHLVLLCAFGLLGLSPAQAQTADRSIPVLQQYITDLSGSLSNGEVQRLESKLERFERETSNQIVVLIVPSLEGESLEEFTLQVAEKNKVGKKGRDNGALFLVAKNDRQIRIEVGYGLEGVLTDATGDQIIRRVVAPRFRDGDFSGGIDAGVDSIMAATKGEFAGEPEGRRSRRGVPSILFPVLLFLFFGIFSRLFRSGRRHYMGPRGYYSSGGPWWFGGMGGGGLGGGGFGGGGFSGGGFSGGGGSFGGGGASGSW
jgi:uncharacterized protein